MEIHQLRYFVAVATSGNFSKAAKQCLVAQPTLSQQIKKLEDGLGQRLFDRLGRTIALTPFGTQLLPQAQSILRQIAEVDALSDQGGDSQAGQLRIGAIPTIEPRMFARAIRRFSKEYPRIGLSVQEDFTENLVQALLNVELDLGFMSLPIEEPLIDTQLILAEPLFLAMNAKNPLAKCENISMSDIEQYSFIALDQDQCLGRQINSFCLVKQYNINIACCATQISTVRRWVSGGLGIAFIPAISSRFDTDRTVRYKSIYKEQLERPIVAARLRGRSQSRIVDDFIEIFTDECKQVLNAS